MSPPGARRAHRSEYPGVIPMLAYENGPEAMDWLARVFGFRERARMLGEDGRLSHGEMETDGGMIMLATPSPHYHGPRKHSQESEAARKWLEVPYIVDGVLVYVDDVEAHYRRARENGATILSPLEAGQEGKRYRAEDLEGHRWMFMQRQR